VRDVNARSIGIEIVNPGHEFGYREFPERRSRRSSNWTQGFSRVIAFRLSACSAIRRRARAQTGSGELFPWKRLAEAGWAVAGGFEKKNGAVRNCTAVLRPIFRPRLRHSSGYGCFFGIYDHSVQRHWRPTKLDGIAECGVRTDFGGAAGRQSQRLNLSFPPRVRAKRAEDKLRRAPRRLRDIGF